MKRAMILFLALALMLAGSTALAMPVQITEGTMSISATGVEENALPEQLELESFQMDALNAQGGYVIFANNRFYNVDAETLQPLLTVMGSPAVPALGGLETLVRGSNNDEVKRLQEALTTLGYLKGAIDGDFGGATERGVKAFQADEGLEETGEADALLQLLAQSVVAEAIEVEPIVDPEVMFAPIEGRTTVDLQPVLDSGLAFSYDDMTGEGFITDGSKVSYDASGEADIDKYQLSVAFGLLTRENEDGNVDLLPAAKVSCLCVRRPVLNKLTVKAGTIALRGSAAFESLEATLSGVDSLEQGVVLLDDNMVDALAAAGEAGELKLRLTGQYNTFDFAASGAQLASLSKIGQLAQQIRG